MPLTWKWSTNTGTLSGKVKKKPWILASLAKKLKWVWTKARQLTQTNEAKAIKHVITNPWEVASSGLRELSKASWKVWEFLQDSWSQAEAADLPVVSQAGSITRAAWALIGGPESARQNVIRIWEQVKDWKLTVADWILEAGTSTGLQGITLIAAPFLQAINSGLNITGLDKPLEQWIQWGTQFLTQLTADVFGLKNKDGSPSAKAESRVNSALNVLRGVWMYKGWKIINKWWAKNFVKGSTVISSPDIALSVLAFWAKEEGKELPTPTILKGITANALTALVPTPWQGVKWGKNNLKNSITTPKVRPVKSINISKQLKGDDIISIKPEYTAKQIAKINSHNKGIQKKQKNNIESLNELQAIKREGKTKEVLVDSKTQLDLKKDLINQWKKDKTVINGRTDKWLDSALFTAKGKDLWAKWKWVHTPKETARDLALKNLDLPKEGITKTDLKSIIKEEAPLNIEAEAPVKTDTESSFIDGDGNQKSNIDYFGKEEYGNLKSRLNIAAQRFTKDGSSTKLGRLKDIAKGTANIALDSWKSLKDAALSTIWGFLDAVVTVDQDGVKQTLWDLMWGIKGRLTSVRENTSNVLKIAEIDKFLNKNVSGIDAGFKFIKWQDINKLIPWTDIPSRMRRFFIEKAQDANELYAKNLWEKQSFANKVSVVAQYVGWEIKARLRILKQAEIDAINKKDISQEVKNDLINEIVTSSDDISRVQSEVISSMPAESQKFLNEYFDTYGQFKEGTVLKNSFETIWAELNEKGILKNPKENYTHGYVPDQVLREYIRISGKDMGLSKQDVSSFLKEGRPLTPEQRSSILKQSNNVWYLHSQDPASIAHSYLNETQELIHHRMIDDLLDVVSKDDPKVAAYLKGMKDQNSKIYNDVKDISRPKNIAIRAVDKYLNASAYGLYILNPTLIAQNAFTSGIYGLGKAISGSVTGRSSYWRDVFTKRNRAPTAELLFNKWLLSHRDVDANIGFKWDATIGNKIVRNTKKYVWEQPMQKSTALWVKTIQVITANAFMKKFVWDDIKTGETLSSAYQRKLATLSPEEKLKAETNLYREVVTIENPTNLNKATNAAFDVKLFGMVTSWARWNSSFIVSKTMDIVDTVHNNINAAAKRKGYTKIKDGNTIDNATMITTKLVLAYTAAKILWEMLYDEDDDRRDEIKKKINAESLADNMKYFLTHSTWIAWASIWLRNFAYINDYGIQLMDAYENWDEETAQKATEQFVLRWFSWVKKAKDAVQWDNDQITRSWEFKFKDEFENETLWDAVWRVMWISRSWAEYSQSYTRLVKLENEIKKKSWNYSSMSLMFDQLKRHLPTIAVWSKNNQNVKFRVKVDRLNRNIRDLGIQKVWFNDWMNAVYEGIEDPSEARTLAEEKLGEGFVKNANSNLKKVGKLQHVMKEINSVKWVEVFPDDFGKTLESLKWTHPKLYNKFMKQVYWTISSEGITPELREANSKFIDNVISADLGGEMLATNISGLVRRVAGLDVDLKREAGTITNDRDKLESLEKVLQTLENAPVLQEQILSSLSELVPTSITSKNAQDIYDSIQQYPIIQTLYRRAAELRWAVLLDGVEKEVENQGDISTIEPEVKLSWKINTNWNNLWTLPTSSVKANWNLIDLKLKPKQQTQVSLEKVDLRTLLDKVI